ncbi:MAG: hypothetical protein HY258_08205 [Chloroflexi bacterium]|nr:hypothetical protein [Chloroflexota bacterium]
MRFHELGIETQRQTPSNVRTEGFAFLVRANYITREGQPTQLGEQTLAKLKALSQSDSFFEKLKLPILKAGDEIYFEIPTGEVEVLQCPACHYAARHDLALIKKQALPAEDILPLEKVLTPGCNTIESLANFLGISKERTAKALMFMRLSDNQFVFVVVRGDMTLSEAKLKKLVGDVRAATTEEIAKSGAAAGYASPVGLKDELIVVDDLIPQSANLVAGANESGYHFKNTNYGRDYSAEIVADLVLASAGDPCAECGKPMVSLDASLLADKTGYHFQNILGALAEVHHDNKGLTFPPPVAPFAVYLMQLPGKQLDTRAKAEELYEMLKSTGVSVLFDDRDERAGVKFNDADLIGCPVRVTVGEKNLHGGMVELKPRTDVQTYYVLIEKIIDEIKAQL